MRYRIGIHVFMREQTVDIFTDHCNILFLICRTIQRAALSSVSAVAMGVENMWLRTQWLIILRTSVVKDS